ncbi:hypothetical protein AAES_116825 [Amazona aestiva]|uniref:Uncharacterized protein n=1 Tax=Amazona aestiva TaxID=12930 RepID=A0A0Q3URC6_AMAAE|nr:hypothetical protein AAES_116825 [Amazona aestiva]
MAFIKDKLNPRSNHNLETVSWAFAEKWLKIEDPLNQQQYKGSSVNLENIIASAKVMKSVTLEYQIESKPKCIHMYK